MNSFQKKKAYIAVGTWAEHYNGSRGGQLRVYQADGEQFSLCQTLVSGKSISTLAWDERKGLLFAACETNYHGEGKPGGEIQIYRMENGRSLVPVGVCSSYGGFPIGLALTERYALVLNHGSNLARVCRTHRDETGRIVTEFVQDEASLCLFRRTETGDIGELSDQYLFHGSGKVPFFQESPSPHDLYYSPEKSICCVPMRGTDETKVFYVDEKNGRLVLSRTLQSRSGTGPRNVVCLFGGQRDMVYVASEIEPLLTIFGEANGSCEMLRELPVTEHIPEGIACTSFSYPHPSGILLNIPQKKLYVTIRASDSLSVYSVLENGLLRKEREIPLEGKNPRQMLLWRNRLYLVCMDTGCVLEYELDEQGYPGKAVSRIQGVERIAFIAPIIG